MTAGFIKAGKQEVPERVCKDMEIMISANLTSEAASQSFWPYSLCHIQFTRSSSHSQDADYRDLSSRRLASGAANLVAAVYTEVMVLKQNFIRLYILNHNTVRVYITPIILRQK